MRRAVSHIANVVVGTPRQSGKSTLTLLLILYRMLAAEEQWVSYGAQTRLAARTRLFDRWWPRVQRSSLGSMFKLFAGDGRGGVALLKWLDAHVVEHRGSGWSR